MDQLAAAAYEHEYRLAANSSRAYRGFMTELTEILSKIDAGDPQASSELLPLVYDELRKLAVRKMASERPDHTLQATALVHEAYVRLVDADGKRDWDSRGHFFAAAARAMQRILVDHARSKTCEKRGGNATRLEMTEFPESADSLAPELILELNDALEKLERQDAAIADLVRLRTYAGFSVAESAKLLGISRTKAFEDWDYALAWLAVELDSSP